MKVQIALFDCFDELDAIAPYEVVRNAAKVGADVQVSIVTQTAEGEVTAKNGLRIRADARLDTDIGSDIGSDILLVPGGGWIACAPQRAWNTNGAEPSGGKTHRR